jgi:hypothetical protein
MPKLSAIAAIVACGLVGCGPYEPYQPNYYVADVQLSGGQLVATRCQLDAFGHATSICETNAVPDDSGPVMPQSSIPIAPHAARPAPDAPAIDRAIAASGTHRLLELCRTTYARDTSALTATLSIAPSGEITRVELPSGSAAFAECVAHALRTTTLSAFDGQPIEIDQPIAL